MHGLWISILQFSALSQATENEGYEVMGPGRGVEGEKEIQGLARTCLGTSQPKPALAVPGAQGFSYLQSGPTFTEDIACVFDVSSYFLQCSQGTEWSLARTETVEGVTKTVTCTPKTHAPSRSSSLL